MEILLVERPVARDLGPLDPVEPLRLFEPEAARIGEAAAVHLRIGFRIDARVLRPIGGNGIDVGVGHAALLFATCLPKRARKRSEEHTSELQSLMRISYAVFC